MTDRAVISVHAKPDTSERLTRLAKVTSRSRSYLANEAIEQYLAAAEEFLASIDKGIEQVEAGEGSSTHEMMERASKHFLDKSNSSKIK